LPLHDRGTGIPRLHARALQVRGGRTTGDRTGAAVQHPSGLPASGPLSALLAQAEGLSPSGCIQRSRRHSQKNQPPSKAPRARSEEHTTELQSRENLVCRLLLEKKKTHSE